MLPSPLRRLLAAFALAWAALACGALPAGAVESAGALPSRSWGTFGFKSYGGDQGLTTLSVSVMAQDESGFLWVGTEDGLFRYDGETFTRFGTREGLPDTGVIALAPASDGGLWVLTRTGLSRKVGERFQPLPAAAGLPKPDDLIQLGGTLACDAQNRLWIATRQGLYVGGPSGFWPADGLPKEPTGSVWIDPQDGTLLAGQAGGLIWRRRPGGAWEEGRLPAPHQDAAAIGLVQDRGGRIWARGSTWLVRFDRGLKERATDLSAALPGRALRDPLLFADPEGRVWAPTEAGLACFTPTGRFVLDESWGLPGSWAGCVLVDREGSLWVGSEGVHRVLGRMLWSASTRRQGLPSDTVWSVARTADGRVWAGTQRGLAEGTAQGWRPVPATAGQAIVSLAPDGAGGLWAGPSVPGSVPRLGVWHLAAGGAPAWVELPGSSGGDVVQGLSLAEDGTLWIASQGGDIWRVPRGGAPLPMHIQGLPAGATAFALLARRGTVWLSTDRGLALLERGAWRILGRADGLRSANTQALALSPGGELWVSYGDLHGLTILRQEGGRWAVAAQVQAAPLNEDAVVSMAFDPAGRLWLGTSRGVKQWDGQLCRRFGRGDGLPGEDADGNAVWADAESVWFGLSNGLARFNGTAGLAPVASPLARVISVTDGGGHGLATDGDLLQVRYPYRSMDFDYAALSFVNEGRIRLQIRLQGFEDAWRDTKFREARYTALPPGYYRFEVRAALGDGPFGNPDTVDFRVLAPWWRTWWFYIACFVLAAALVLATVRWRTAVLEARNRQLEALVRARTMDLERANEQLKESSMVDALTGLKNRRYLGMNLPEEEARVLRAFRTLQASGRAPSGEDLVFLLVDLDHFKTVNDTWGHAAGDLVLKQASEAIRAATREADTVARWGGEEFLVIARRADRRTGEVIARKILEEVSGRVYPVANGQELRLTCSVGFSAFPMLLGDPGAFGWEDVVEIADQCLYAAKRTGRNAYVGVFLEETAPDPEVHARLLPDLPGLVAEGRIQLRTSFPDGRPLDWKVGH